MQAEVILSWNHSRPMETGLPACKIRTRMGEWGSNKPIAKKRRFLSNITARSPGWPAELCWVIALSNSQGWPCLIARAASGVTRMAIRFSAILGMLDKSSDNFYFVPKWSLLICLENGALTLELSGRVRTTSGFITCLHPTTETANRAAFPVSSSEVVRRHRLLLTRTAYELPACWQQDRSERDLEGITSKEREEAGA